VTTLWHEKKGYGGVSLRWGALGVTSGTRKNGAFKIFKNIATLKKPYVVQFKRLARRREGKRGVYNDDLINCLIKKDKNYTQKLDIDMENDSRVKRRIKSRIRSTRSGSCQEAKNENEKKKIKESRIESIFIDRQFGA